ncbi:MAG: STAS domain-containing protein [Desulfobacteraceae bacterium]|nr:STAS domain-containing protein [Desulfobacteraceae bacterium]
MEIKVENRGEGVLVRISGRLDAVTAAELDAAFGEILEGGGHNVIVSMEELEYISSAGLRVILLFAKKLHGGQGQVGFAALSGNVKEIFDISGFYSLFKIYDTVEEAFAA